MTEIPVGSEALLVGVTSSVPEKSWADAILIRAFEERLFQLFSEGRIFGTVHTCIGQEFSGVAFARTLEPGDLLFSNHRCHGHYLARTGDVDGLMAEIMGRETGICGGRGGSQHICAHGVFSNGVQGGIMPVSAGLAFAEKLRGSGKIVLTFIGDGTLGQGAVYETFNIVSKWDLPLLVILENNSYAQSTHQSQTLAGDIVARAEAFGIRSMHADTWDPETLAGMAAEAVEYVRRESRPLFFQVDTYRLMAHSKGDDNREKAELSHHWAIDPITRFTEAYPEQARVMREDAAARVTAAVERAELAPFTQLDAIAGQRDDASVWRRGEITGPKERVVNRIYSSLKKNMALDERILCIGEDIIGPYGGAFKVTKDLSDLFPGRVRSTPISEAAIAGIGSGLALGGFIPVCEIMFGDFLTLAADQIINHAAKFRFMYRDQVRTPLILRVPMGGKRGYGATHSQSLEKHFLGIPDTKVIAIHHRYDPALVYDRLFATVDCPTIVIENKVLYGEYVSTDAPPGFFWEYGGDEFPVTRLRSRAKPDITLVCYGGVLLDAEKAVDRLFEEHEIVAEVVCPIQIYPLDLAPVLESVRASGRLLVIEEGQLFCGFGGELIAGLRERAPELATRVGRLGAAPHAIPSCKPAELSSLPTPDSIVEYVVRTLAGE